MACALICTECFNQDCTNPSVPAGAKDKLGLRVHGLIVGSPEKKRADPAVLRSLCSQVLPNGKMEVLIPNSLALGDMMPAADVENDYNALDAACANTRTHAVMTPADWALPYLRRPW